MATLLGTKIKDTYTGLLKMNDNLAIGDLSPRPVSDGAGTDSALAIAQRRVDITTDNAYLSVNNTSIDLQGLTVIDGQATGNITIQNTPQALVSGTNAILSDASFTNYLNAGATSVVAAGTFDFSGATVNGLPASGGIVPGAGVSTNGAAYLSMVSGPSVSNNPAVALGGGDIVIGEGAYTSTNNGGWASNNVVIGSTAHTSHAAGVAIGTNAYAYEKGIAVGLNSNANGLNSISIGSDRAANGGGAVGIGQNSNVTQSNGVQIGAYAGCSGQGAVSLGWAAGASTTYSIGIGRLSNQSGSEGIAIGNFSRANNPQSIAIGVTTAVNADGAVALGRNITAAKADTVSVTELETQLAGGGITMKSPNGTEYKLTVSDAGALVIT